MEEKEEKELAKKHQQQQLLREQEVKKEHHYKPWEELKGKGTCHQQQQRWQGSQGKQHNHKL